MRRGREGGEWREKNKGGRWKGQRWKENEKEGREEKEGGREGAEVLNVQISTDIKATHRNNNVT